MASIEDILKTIPAEYLAGNLLDTGVATVTGSPAARTVTLTYPYPAASVAARAQLQLAQKLAAANLAPVPVTYTAKIARRMCQGGVERVAGVSNIIAVSSAKGGVGKSLVAVNLALALQAEGVKAGLLDADIYGPSVPIMLGGARPEVDENDRIVPLRLHNIQALSMGHLVDADQAMIWRGPMVVKAVRQLLRDTAWDELDFLVLDLPPGTGDIQLSVAQGVPVAGAIIVTTLQELALADAVRGLKMFEKVSVPVLGHVANMTTFKCSGCGQVHRLFGSDATKLEHEHGLSLLAELPLDPVLAGTTAMPIMAAAPDGDTAKPLRELAVRIGVALLERPVDRGAVFPKIVVGKNP